MMKPTIWQKNISILLGFVSILFFGFAAFYFSKIQPKMIRFDALTTTEEGLLNWVGGACCSSWHFACFHCCAPSST